MMKRLLLPSVTALAFLATTVFSSAADHRDGPRITNNSIDGALDLNDLYIFQSPANAANTVIIVTVNPFAGIFSRTTFATLTDFDINIDNNGDAETDQRFRINFGPVKTNGVQTYRLFHKKGTNTQVAAGRVGEASAVIGGGQFTCGIFDDPFFFDVVAFRNGANFVNPGTNFFRGMNVLALVLEVPSSLIQAAPGNTNIGAWCATRRGTRQVDRMGRPAINTALINKANKDRFNSSHPRDDVTAFTDVMISSLMGPPFNRSQADAAALSDALLPDILTFNTASAAGFLNGRRLQDDVIDAELALLTGSPSASDHVSNDSNFLTVFPYLQAANP